jgi:hypothetical protein
VSFINGKIRRLPRLLASRNRQHNRLAVGKFADARLRALACSVFAGFERTSDPIAGLPNEDNKNRDQSGRDEHPVLAFESKKSKVIDQNLHASVLIFGQDKRFDDENVLFLYFLSDRRRRPADHSRLVCSALAWHERCAWPPCSGTDIGDYGRGWSAGLSASSLSNSPG